MKRYRLSLPQSLVSQLEFVAAHYGLDPTDFIKGQIIAHYTAIKIPPSRVASPEPVPTTKPQKGQHKEPLDDLMDIDL